MGLAQLVGGLLCQKYGGKVVFGYSNLMLGVANFLIPVAAGINIYVLIAVRAAQGMAGVSYLFLMLQYLPRVQKSTDECNLLYLSR